MSPDTVQPEEHLKRSWTYLPDEGFYDEMIAGDGSVRTHWRPLVERLEEMGETGFTRRWQEGRRLIHENGTTYNVYSESQNTERRWPVDPIPLAIDQKEWSHIESAIIQRAILLNAVLADLYGPQKLLSKGL